MKYLAYLNTYDSTVAKRWNPLNTTVTSTHGDSQTGEQDPHYFCIDVFYIALQYSCEPHEGSVVCMTFRSLVSCPALFFCLFFQVLCILCHVEGETCCCMSYSNKSRKPHPAQCSSVTGLGMRSTSGEKKRTTQICAIG